MKKLNKTGSDYVFVGQKEDSIRLVRSSQSLFKHSAPARWAWVTQRKELDLGLCNPCSLVETRAKGGFVSLE